MISIYFKDWTFCTFPYGPTGVYSLAVVHLANIMTPCRFPEFFSAPDKYFVLVGVELELFRNNCMEVHCDSFCGAQQAGGKSHRKTLIRSGLSTPCPHTHAGSHMHTRSCFWACTNTHPSNVQESPHFRQTAHHVGPLGSPSMVEEDSGHRVG